MVIFTVNLVRSLVHTERSIKDTLEADRSFVENTPDQVNGYLSFVLKE